MRVPKGRGERTEDLSPSTNVSIELGGGETSSGRVLGESEDCWEGGDERQGVQEHDEATEHCDVRGRREREGRRGGSELTEVASLWPR